MAVYQVNIWTCDGCGVTVTTGEDVCQYDDPVVLLEHEHWKIIGEIGNEKLVCEICQRNQ